MDQIAAKTLGSETQLASLELALESVELLGACDAGYSCAYTNTISWRTPTTPLPMENDPRAVFERLFGAATAPIPPRGSARLAEGAQHPRFGRRQRRRLQRGLGARDRAKLDRVPRGGARHRAAHPDGRGAERRELPVVEQPAGDPELRGARAADVRSAGAGLPDRPDPRTTFMIGREVSGRAYPEIGVPDAHHPMSHHQNDPEKLAKLAKINMFHMQQFAYFLEKLAATPDGDGSLLDHSMILYGSGISDSNMHIHDNLPMVLVGRRRRPLKGGRHVRVSEGHAGDQSLPRHAGQARRARRNVRRQHRPARLSRRRFSSCTRGYQPEIRCRSRSSPSAAPLRSTSYNPLARARSVRSVLMSPARRRTSARPARVFVHADDVKAERRLDRSLISPGLTENAAASNAGSMRPRGNVPTRPPIAPSPRPRRHRAPSSRSRRRRNLVAGCRSLAGAPRPAVPGSRRSGADQDVARRNRFGQEKPVAIIAVSAR